MIQLYRFNSWNQNQPLNCLITRMIYYNKQCKYENYCNNVMRKCYIVITKRYEEVWDFFLYGWIPP